MILFILVAFLLFLILFLIELFIINDTFEEYKMYGITYIVFEFLFDKNKRKLFINKKIQIIKDFINEFKIKG